MPKRTVTVEIRTIEGGWVVATSEDAPGFYAADRSREGLEHILRRALVRAFSEPGRENLQVSPLDNDWLSRQFARYELRTV